MTSCLTKLADHIKDVGAQSCRKLAEYFETSKSSVHRKQQKIKDRANLPGASFFESNEGQKWILRMVGALCSCFWYHGWSWC